MYVVEIHYTRPSTDVPFYTDRPSYLDNITALARASGDLESQVIEMIEPLRARYKAVWRSREAWAKWVEGNPLTAALNKKMDDYHAKHGITSQRIDQP